MSATTIPTDAATTARAAASASASMNHKPVANLVATTLSTVKETVAAVSTTSTLSSTPLSTSSAASSAASSAFTSASTPPQSQDDKILNVSDLTSSLQHFGFIDYFVFVSMLVVCAGIGFYFGFIEKKNKKNKQTNLEQRRGSEALDYLVGGRKMKVFPVSLSLVAR